MDVDSQLPDHLPERSLIVDPSLASETRIKVAPVHAALFAVCGYVLHSFGLCALMYFFFINDRYAVVVIEDSFHYYVFWGTVLNVFWIHKYWLCHKGALARRAINTQLLNFSVMNAQCTDEADRALIYDGIRAWFGSLDSFNMLVRERLQSVIRGPLHVVAWRSQFEEMVMWFWCYDCLVWAESVDQVWRIIVVMGGLQVVWRPLFLYSLSCLARWTIDLQLSSVLKTALRIVLVPLLGLSCPAWLHLTNNAPLGVSTAIGIVGTLLAYVLYLPPR